MLPDTVSFMMTASGALQAADGLHACMHPMTTSGLGVSGAPIKRCAPRICQCGKQRVARNQTKWLEGSKGIDILDKTAKSENKIRAIAVACKQGLAAKPISGLRGSKQAN
jgi:hypothetical protein